MTGFPVVVPFVDHLGARLLSCADGSAHTQLDLAPHHCNSFGVAHGGVLMTLLDVTMACALARNMPATADGTGDDRDEGDLHAARAGAASRRTGAASSARAMAFCEADIVDEGGRTVARASGTFKYVRQR